MIPVIQENKNKNKNQEDEDRVSLTHASGAQVGRALPAFLQTARCSGGVGVEPACCLEVEMFVCVCACVCVFVWSGTHSVGRRAHSSPTRPSPSADKLSPRRLQPAAPTAVRSLSPRFFVPGRPAADNFPLTSPHPTLPLVAYPGRDATSRPEQPTGSLQTRLGGAPTPRTLQLNRPQPAETRRCSDHPGRRCWSWRGRKGGRQKTPNERLETRQRFN